MVSDHVYAYLQSNLLRHLVHLKYLHLYGEQLVCHSIEQAGGLGLLLHHPIEMTFWDSQTYPDARRVLLPTASDHTTAAQLADYAVQHFTGPLVIKFCDDLTRAAFVAHFELRPARTLISYTTQHAPSRPPQTHLVTTPTSALLALFQQNGYSEADIQQYFDDDARAIAILDGDQPVSACMLFRNFGQVWEIAGVHTLPHARRRGYARQVVQAALADILGRGLIPRYQTESTNRASMGVAESLGMRICLRFEHYQTL